MEISEVITRLQGDPALIANVAAREFEEVVAELLASMGWEVNLTPPSRDGGLDILGISRDASGFETSWIVECKRYETSRRVGVGTMRALYGIQEQLRVPRALLVTTSTVTRAAAEFAKAVGIEIADGDVLRAWIKRYKAAQATPHSVSQRFRSCFVSHSSADADFVAELVKRLRDAGVRTWYAPEDLVPGRKIHEEVAAAIATFDRLIVVLSESSIASRWVQTELRWARRREREEGARVLFPVSLVPFQALTSFELFDADSGQDLAAEIREYFVPDFSRWHERTAFDRSMKTLLKGLAASDDTPAGHGHEPTTAPASVEPLLEELLRDISSEARRLGLSSDVVSKAIRNATSGLRKAASEAGAVPRSDADLSPLRLAWNPQLRADQGERLGIFRLAFPVTQPPKDVIAALSEGFERAHIGGFSLDTVFGAHDLWLHVWAPGSLSIDRVVEHLIVESLIDVYLDVVSIETFLVAGTVYDWLWPYDVSRAGAALKGDVIERVNRGSAGREELTALIDAGAVSYVPSLPGLRFFTTIGLAGPPPADVIDGVRRISTSGREMAELRVYVGSGFGYLVIEGKIRPGAAPAALRAELLDPLDEFLRPYEARTITALADRAPLLQKDVLNPA